MEIVRPAATATAVRQLGALVAIARAARDGLGQPQRAFLNAVQRCILETDEDLDALPIVSFPDVASPDEIAAGPLDAREARQLIRLMVVTCLANGLPSRAQIALLERYATALAVREPAISTIRHLAYGHIWRFRVAFLRRSHFRLYFRNTYRRSGSALRVLRAVLIFRGILREDAATIHRYRALGMLPNGSLGRCFFDHLRTARLPFPGERGGFPEGAIFHDFAHVLAGFDTTPEGEMQAAAFQAGFTRDAVDFFTWLFSIVLHTTGINLLPFSIPLRVGRIGEGTLAVDVLDALKRGSAVATDLGADWDYWQDVALPLASARARLGIPPNAAPFDASGRRKPGVAVHEAAESAQDETAAMAR
jgi:hypothetical protein